MITYKQLPSFLYIISISSPTASPPFPQNSQLIVTHILPHISSPKVFRPSFVESWPPIYGIILIQTQKHMSPFYLSKYLPNFSDKPAQKHLRQVHPFLLQEGVADTRQSIHKAGILPILHGQKAVTIPPGRQPASSIF